MNNGGTTWQHTVIQTGEFFMIVRASYKLTGSWLGCNYCVTDVLCLSDLAILRDSFAL